MPQKEIKKAVIIQARTGSTRLPGKVLIDILGKTVLERVLERVSYAKKVDKVVVATTNKKEDDIIELLTKKAGYYCYRGSEEDVLLRYLEASREFKSDIIIRISADCPLIDPFLIDDIIEFHIQRGGDYTSNLIKRTYPRGIAVEVFPKELLEKLNQIVNEPFYREHVTLYVRKNIALFKVNNYEDSYSLYNPKWRWVLDTKDDLPFIIEVYRRLSHMKIFSMGDILELMKKDKYLMEMCPIHTEENTNIVN